MIHGILNGRELSAQYLQPDGSYLCDPFWYGPVEGDIAAWEYQIAARITGAPTGGGMLAWFSRILPTNGLSGVLAESETNDAHGALLQPIHGSDIGLLPQGDWPPFAVPYNAADDTIIARSILNVPHALCVKSALTGGTSPDVKLTIMRTPLRVAPPRPPVVSQAVAASANLATKIRYVTGWSFAENAGSAADARVLFRDTDVNGAVVRDIRIPAGSTKEMSYDRPLYFPGGLYVLVSAGTVRGSVEGE